MIKPFFNIIQRIIDINKKYYVKTKHTHFAEQYILLSLIKKFFKQILDELFKFKLSHRVEEIQNGGGQGYLLTFLLILITIYFDRTFGHTKHIRFHFDSNEAIEALDDYIRDMNINFKKIQLEIYKECALTTKTCPDIFNVELTKNNTVLEINFDDELLTESVTKTIDNEFIQNVTEYYRDLSHVLTYKKDFIEYLKYIDISGKNIDKFIDKYKEQNAVPEKQILDNIVSSNITEEIVNNQTLLHHTNNLFKNAKLFASSGFKVIGNLSTTFFETSSDIKTDNNNTQINSALYNKILEKFNTLTESVQNNVNVNNSWINTASGTLSSSIKNYTSSNIIQNYVKNYYIQDFFIGDRNIPNLINIVTNIITLLSTISDSLVTVTQSSSEQYRWMLFNFYISTFVTIVPVLVLLGILFNIFSLSYKFGQFITNILNVLNQKLEKQLQQPPEVLEDDEQPPNLTPQYLPIDDSNTRRIIRRNQQLLQKQVHDDDNESHDLEPITKNLNILNNNRPLRQYIEPLYDDSEGKQQIVSHIQPHQLRRHRQIVPTSTKLIKTQTSTSNDMDTEESIPTTQLKTHTFNDMDTEESIPTTQLKTPTFNDMDTEESIPTTKTTSKGTKRKTTNTDTTNKRKKRGGRKIKTKIKKHRRTGTVKKHKLNRRRCQRTRKSRK